MLEFNSGQWLAELHKQVAQDRARLTPEFMALVEDIVNQRRCELEEMEIGNPGFSTRGDRAAESDFMVGLASRLCGF